jgi:hypothetical protein
VKPLSFECSFSLGLKLSLYQAMEAHTVVKR